MAGGIGGVGGAGGTGGNAGVSGQDGGAGLEQLGFPATAGGLGGTAPGGNGGEGESGGNGGGGGGGAHGAVVSIAGDIAPASGGRGGNGGQGSPLSFFANIFSGGGGGEGGLGVHVLASGAFRNPGGTIAGGDGGDGGGPSSEAFGAFRYGYGGSGGSGVLFAMASVSFDNTGSITAGDGGSGGHVSEGGVGVDFAAGTGVLLNSGSIAGGNAFGTATSGGAGVRGNDLEITNTGSIEGGEIITGGFAFPAEVGAGIAGSNLTIVNSGSIKGGIAGSNVAITNSGSIIAGSEPSGALRDALTIGGGSNTLTLKRGTTIRGDVGLQAGSLAIEVVTGLATSIVGALDSDGSLIKTGAGRLAIKGMTANDGVITVRGGVLALDGGVTGTGSATIEAGATLQLAGTAVQDTHFAGAKAMLELVDPASYSGTLVGLSPTDRIALDDTTVTRARARGTTLTVDTTGDVLTFTLAEPFHYAFRVDNDPTGDSILTVLRSIAWARGVSGDWQGSANWKPTGGAPTVDDNARIAVAGTYTIASSTDNGVNELVLANAAATLAIAGGTTFTVGGQAVRNAGTIALGSAGAGASLVFEDDATLDGRGTIGLSDSADNLIAQAGLGAITLTNRSTVAGAGTIGRGDGQMTFVNKSMVEADQSQALVIHTGNTIVNIGTLEATGAGGLVILDAVENASRRNGLFANGGDITVAGAVTRGGAARIDGATLEFEAASNARVTFLGTTGQLTLDDADVFTGTVAGLDSGPGNVISLADIGFVDIVGRFRENAAGTGGKLMLSDGTDSARITLLGHYAANFTTAPTAGYTGFVFADDGTPSHGTLLSYVHA